MEIVLQNYQHLLIALLVVIGLYTMMAYDNLIKKLIGLNILQVAVFIFFIFLGVVEDSTAPLLSPEYTIYANPIPHVLILTAIVVNVSVTAMGLALVIKIKSSCGSLSEKMIEKSQESK